MTIEGEKVADVIEAFKQRGFEFKGSGSDGWLKLHGQLKCSATSHPCEVQLDPQFFKLPRVRLLQVPAHLPRVVPHLASGGELCYIAKGTVVLDIFDPVGQALSCLQRAEEVLDDVVQGNHVEDLAEEFYAYWSGPLCLVDVQGDRLGSQQTLLVKLGGDLTAVVTDDENRSKKKLKSLGWEMTDRTLLTYLIRTSARPRPHIGVWPPKTLKDILAWQSLLDPRCRKKIEKRVAQALATSDKGALILVKSPLMTYGFTVLFDLRPDRIGMRRLPRPSMYALEVTPMSVVRIDDRYMAERNVPGKRMLGGQRLAVVGCGTVGGYLAEMLVKVGAGTSGGQLTLVDFENLTPQNIGRHRLGFPNLFANKATGLAEELRRLAPGADIRALPVNVQEAELGNVDLLIDATGEESLGHWLCKRYLPATSMLSVWVEGPGTAVRTLLRTNTASACHRCLFEFNRQGQFAAVVGGTPIVMAGQGCEGLYVPFPASVSVQSASLGAEMALAWANESVSPSLRTKLVDATFQLATPDCDPPIWPRCPACTS